MADDAKEEGAPPATAPMEVDDIAEAAADAMEVPAPAPAPAPAILADLKFDDATVDQALEACAQGTLADLPPLEWSERPAITVVMAANGYPGTYKKGTVIKGVDDANAMHGVTVFEAGTARNADGERTAAGGRVLNVTATGENLHYAVDRAYAGVDALDWPEGFCRRDIAWRALKRH